MCVSGDWSAMPSVGREDLQNNRVRADKTLACALQPLALEEL